MSSSPSRLFRKIKQFVKDGSSSPRSLESGSGADGELMPELEAEPKVAEIVELEQPPTMVDLSTVNPVQMQQDEGDDGTVVDDISDEKEEEEEGNDAVGGDEVESSAPPSADGSNRLVLETFRRMTKSREEDEEYGEDDGSLEADLSSLPTPRSVSTKFQTSTLSAATKFIRSGSRHRKRGLERMEEEVRMGNIGKKLILGDVITIRQVDNMGVDSGYLAGEGLQDDTIGVYFGHVGGNSDQDCHFPSESNDSNSEFALSVNFAEFYFRICPQLRYDMQKSLEKMNKRGQHSPEQRAYLVDRAEKEQRENEEMLSRCLDSRVHVRYGQVIQLQHVRSGKFLSFIAKKVAKVEKDCLLVELVENGSEASWFRIVPRFKVRAEGASVYAGDQIYFQSCKHPDYSLGCSKEPLKRSMFAEPCTGLSERKIWREAHLNVRPRSWRIHLAMRGMDLEEPSDLFNGQALHLFHPEVESLICGQLNYGDRTIHLEKSEVNSFVRPDRGIWTVELSSSCPPSSSLISSARRKRNVGAIIWGDAVSFRHLVTGRYLTVDVTSLDPIKLNENGGLIRLKLTVAHQGPYSTFVIIPSVQKKKHPDDDELEQPQHNHHHHHHHHLNMHAGGGIADFDVDGGNKKRKSGGISLSTLTFCLEFYPPEPLYLDEGGTFPCAYLHVINSFSLMDESAINQSTEKGVYFSLVRHDQDALVGLPVDAKIVRDIEMVKNWYRIAMEYCDILRSRLEMDEPSHPSPYTKPPQVLAIAAHETKVQHISHGEADAIIKVLQRLLEYCASRERTRRTYRAQIGGNDVDDEDDEDSGNEDERGNNVKGDKSNNIDDEGIVPEIDDDEDNMNMDNERVKDDLVDHELSVANLIFAKTLPPSDLSAQVRLANLNVFEVLFHIIQLPRAICADDWDKKLGSTNLRWAYFVHRLCFRGAVAIFQNNRALELEFATKTLQSPPRRYCEFLYFTPPTTPSVRLDMLMIVASQLSCGIGAVALLRKLVNNNEKLLDTKFKKPQIERLVGLIRTLGPEKRFLELLASLCTCEDVEEGQSQCVISNQELIALEVFNNKPEEVLLQTSYVLYKTSEIHVEEPLEISEQILGAEQLLHGNMLRSGDVLVHWETCICHFDPMKDFGCKKLYRHQDKLWVSLEELDSSTHPSATRLCSYFLSLLHLFAKMVEGRSYNCIGLVERYFPYELLIVALANTSLRAPYRSAFAQLLNSLYVDRFPHTKLRIPRKTYFQDGKERGQENPYGKYCDMPTFRIETEITLDVDDGKFFRVNSPMKFELLRRVIVDHMRRHIKNTGARKELLTMSSKQRNRFQHKKNDGSAFFVSRLISVATQLLRMGFYQSSTMIAEIGKLSVLLLEFDESHPLRKCEMILRQEICSLLADIAQYDIDHKICVVIDHFEAANNDTLLHKLVAEVSGAFASSCSNTCNGGGYSKEQGKATGVAQSLSSSDLSWNLYDMNHNFTEKGGISIDHMLVQIVIRCGRQIDPTIQLFEKALELLMLEHSPASRLLDGLEDLDFLASENTIHFFKTIKERTSILLNDVESYEMWGVSNEFSAIGWETVHRVKHTLRFLTRACEKHRNLVESLGVVDVIFACLRIDSPDKSRHFKSMKRLGLEFLIAYVEDDAEHQTIVFQELPLLVKLLEHNRVTVILCLSAIVKANRKITVEFPINLTKQLVNGTTDGLESTLLSFLCQLCSVNGLGIKRNQDAILQALLSHESCSTELMDAMQKFRLEASRRSATPPLPIQGETNHKDDGGPLLRSINGEGEGDHDELPAGKMVIGSIFDVMIVELLSAITRGRNPYAESKAQSLLPLDTVLDLLTDKDLSMDSTNEFRCVLCRFLADAYFDTGLTNVGTIQQSPRVIFFLQTVHSELVKFEKRNAEGGDPIMDTLSNFRALVFHGFLFAIRAFFQYAYEFQTAPASILALREPFLVIVQKIQTIAETPSEQHLVRRTRSALLKSISGHRRKKKSLEERQRIIELNKERRLQEAELRRAQRESKRTFRAATKTRGKATPTNWNSFCRWLKSDAKIHSMVQDEQRVLIQSIISSCETFETLISFMRALMDHVRASCDQHIIRFDQEQPLQKAADRTARHVLLIVRYMLENINGISFPWRESSESQSDQETLELAQVRLTQMGAADMCFEIFCIKTSDETARETNKALIALLEGGNRTVQERLYQLFTSRRGENYFRRLEVVFRTIGDAAKLEIKLEKKRRLQEEAMLARDDGETGSVHSGGSSVLMESLAGTSYAYSSYASESHASEEEEDEVDNEVDDDDDDDGLGMENSSSFTSSSSESDEDRKDRGTTSSMSRDGSRDDSPNKRVDLVGLLELGAPKARKSWRRKRNQAELLQKQNARDIVTIVRLLQLCMEGHNLDMQNLLRDQTKTGHKHSSNIVIATVNHALILTKNDGLLASAHTEVVSQLIGILDFLIESMQGPCYGNQTLLADPLHRVIEMIKRILLTQFSLSDTFLNESDFSKVTPEDAEDAGFVLELKGKAVRTLCSMLEGRPDKKVLDILAGEVEPSLVRARFVEIYRAISYYEQLHKGNDAAWSVKLNELMENAIDTMTIMAYLSDYHRDRLTHLNSAGENAADNALTMAQHKALFAANEKESQALIYFVNAVRSVEVIFQGSVHRVFYPKPKALNFLSHSARTRLLREIDVTNMDSRLQEFLESARSLLDEVTQIEQISKALPIRRLLMDLDSIRSTCYILSLMGNFLLLITVVGSDGKANLEAAAAQNDEQDLLRVVEDTSCTNFDYLTFEEFYSNISSGKGMSLFTTANVRVSFFVVRLITIVQIFHLILFRMLYLGTQIPIILKKMKRKLNVARSRLSRASIQKTVDVADTLALPSEIHTDNVYLVSLALVVITFLLGVRFGSDVVYTETYGSFFKCMMALQIALVLKKIRKHGGIPGMGTFSLWYCCLFDAIFEVGTIFHIICIFACFKGLELGDNAFWLVIPLFDIVLSNETLLNVIRAVVVPFQSLLMTFILLALVLYGFAFVGFTNFNAQYFDEELEENPCETLFGCFLLTLDIGLRVGEGPIAAMQRLQSTHEQSMQRYSYNLLFVVVITIFLLNVVFGIIIDTFGSLREEQHEREALLNDNCFICGLPRSEFEAISFEYKQKQDELPHDKTELKSGFAFHISNEHNLFDYLGFILYLEEKDKTECNGLESYVLDELLKSADAVSWIPNGQALALGKQVDKSVSQLEEVENTLLHALNHQTRRLNSLEIKLEVLLEKVMKQQYDR